ncbi:D-alanine--poly(phosphoribitol) ligase [Dickeya sp. CFBP 2040]|uniref:AMP-binding protein n=1 Tax=Dickeya sp. CFBP 2040 TaxID=2718531 RepID=UPI0014484425|nr:AMP-binding protein [Dickeya sp. CFBP 2040]NKI73713.1 D-alanine--poly(phosphoribitol) ligase [Dickeya sp. CFBP 2040]
MFLSQVKPLFEKLKNQEDAIAIINQQSDYSYAALGKRVAAITAYLVPFRGQTVLIHGHKQIDAVAAILASILSNCCFTFVDEANPASRVQKITLMTKATVILNTSDKALDDLEVNAQLMTAALPDGDPSVLSVPDTLTQPLFYILSTSGSTGEPKGVRISYDNFAAFNAWFADDITLNAAGSHVNHACLSFDMGILDLVPPLCRGKTVLMLDHKNNMLPRQNIKLMLRNAHKPITSWFSTPSFAELMLKDAQFNAQSFPSFTHFFIGGERVSPWLIQALQQRFPDMTIFHAYGPTETTCLTHCWVLPNPVVTHSGLLPLGHPRGLNNVLIVDDEGHPLPPGTTGEVRLYGPQVSQGYLPDDHPRNVTFGCDHHGRYYATGDKGYIDKSGSLFICGRDDGQIKLNGNRIEIAEIEMAACDHDNVMQCCLAVSEDRHSASTPHLFVQLADNSPARYDDFRRHLAQRLPANMIPRSIIFQQNFPMTLHAKIDKKALLQELENRERV